MTAQFEALTAGEVKTMLADTLAIVAMSMSGGKSYERDSLNFKLKGSRGDIGAWGAEFVRNLSGEIGAEFSARQNAEPPRGAADLLALVDEILPFNMEHNAEADSVDLLMEVQQLPRLLDESVTAQMDGRNADRLCNYLMKCALYESDPDERRTVFRTAFDLFLRHERASDAVRCALKMGDDGLLRRVFSAPFVRGDAALRKQLCFLLGRHRAWTFQLDEEDDAEGDESQSATASDLNELIGNYSVLSDHFRRLATALDVVDAKTPDEVYKSHLGDTGATGASADGAVGVESARQNAASTYVNGFVNVGFGSDKLITVTGDDGQNAWLYKNKDRGMHSAAASLGMVHQWDVDEGFAALDRFLYVDNVNIKAGAVLGIGVCNAGVYNAEVDAAIGMLPDYLEDDKALSSDGNRLLRTSALMSFGLAYAGTAREEVQELVEPFLEGDADAGDDAVAASMELSAVAALALGMVFVGSADEDAATAVVERLISASDAELATPQARLLCLAVGLIFLGREEAAEASLMVLDTIEHAEIKAFARLTLQVCAYAGTGNVLKVQECLHVCAQHLEAKTEEAKTEEAKTEEKTLTGAEKSRHQGVAALGLALVTVGEEVGSQMAMRATEHLLQYGEPPVKRAVPLALALLHVSHPDFTVVDTLSKLSHDADEAVALNAVLALGLVSAGTNNSRVAGLLRGLSGFYAKQANHLYMVRLAQGMLHMGKGLVTLSPAHSDGMLASRPQLAGLLVVLFAAMDAKETILDRMHYLTYALCSACSPRMLVTLDEELNPLPVSVRVGESVDTVGQAGNPRRITGFQTFTTPVLMATGDRAELVGDEYEALTSTLEGLVVLRKRKGEPEGGEGGESKTA
jgi:26S proteasome regulatory subunit N1